MMECDYLSCHFDQQDKTSNLLNREAIRPFPLPIRIGPHEVERLMEFGCVKCSCAETCSHPKPSVLIGWSKSPAYVGKDVFNLSITFQIANQVGHLRVELVKHLPWPVILAHDWSTFSCS